MKKKFFLVMALCTTTVIFADVHTVTTTADSGCGSLRQAILNANADINPPRSIVFAITNGHNSIVAIELQSHLPALEVELVFDEEPVWYQFGIEKMFLVLTYCSAN
jgi:hypothetical protein